jgi:hypothetical protein
MVRLLLHGVDAGNFAGAYSPIVDQLTARNRDEIEAPLSSILFTVQVLLEYGIKILNETHFSYLLMMLHSEPKVNLLNSDIASFYHRAFHDICTKDWPEAKIESTLILERIKFLSQPNNSNVILGGIKVRLLHEDDVLIENYFVPNLTVDVRTNLIPT